MLKLGIPTVLDRMIQQEEMQFLQRRWDHAFTNIAIGSDPDGRLIKQWRRSSGISPRVTAVR